MPWVDWLVLVGVGLGAYRGATTGILRQAAGILGLVVAFVLALQLMEPVGRLLVRNLPVASELASLVGFLLVLVAARLAFFALRRLVESLLDVLHLSLVNRLGGSLFGAFQGVLVVSLLFLVLGALDVPSEQTRKEAVFYRPAAAALPNTWDALAEHIPQVRTAAEQFGERVESELSGPEQ